MVTLPVSRRPVTMAPMIGTAVGVARTVTRTVCSPATTSISVPAA